MHNFIPIILAAGFGSRINNVSNNPKCLLKVNKKAIIEYTLENLISRGINEVVIIVGYKKEIIQKYLSNFNSKIKITYVYNPKYRKSGHGYSLYLALKKLNLKKDIIMFHGDLFYDPAIFYSILKNKNKNLFMADKDFIVKTHDEWVVLGKKQKMINLKKNSNDLKQVVGEIVGINKWSKNFQKTYLNFCKKLFKEDGILFNWEPIIDLILDENKKIIMNYSNINKKLWININYEDDYTYSKKIYKTVY